MTRVLLTGGSGFIAAHVLAVLLARGHSVVATVRSQAKADTIRKIHSNIGEDKLSFAIVEDIAQPNAFDKTVVSDPPFEAVIHTASPFHYNVTDAQELLGPAIKGTTGILESVQKYAPSVQGVVVTSSFAAITDLTFLGPDKIYSESDWSPVTEEQANESPANAYRASKTFAERAAWNFVEIEKPNFSLAVINPPLVLGPVVHGLTTLENLNTSNQRIRDFLSGASKDKCPVTGNYLFVDVRDLALAHVLAVEKKEAGGKRFFTVASHFSNVEVSNIIGKEFPEFKNRQPTGDALKPGDYPPQGMYGFDNSRVKEVLGVQFRPLEDSILDAAKSLLALGANKYSDSYQE